MQIKIKGPGIVPEYKTKGAAGADLCAWIEQPVSLEVGKSMIVPTGLYVEIPEGFEIQIRPRSGLAAKNGITVLNTPGTIDCDYRGEIGVILINHGTQPFNIAKGDRIAQMVVAPVVRAEFVAADELDVTERGAGGFGSTGK